jgi:pimeloyl-ACP methyl ester carboxylesterase
MPTVDLGISVAYDDAGQGDAVVLIHGHPFDRSMWAPQADALVAAGHRVITADLRGYGASAVTPGITEFATFAGDFAALLDHLGLDRVTLGGLSMGGQIVMECYRLYPARIRALVLADTTPQAETPEGKDFRNQLADRLLAEGMQGYADDMLGRMLAPYNVTAMPRVAAHVRAMMLGTPPAGAAAALRGRAERPDYTELLTRVAVPALVVVGRDDEFTPVAVAEQMRDLIPGARLAVIDNAGHLPNLEQPEAFNTALLDFLAAP